MLLYLLLTSWNLIKTTSAASTSRGTEASLILYRKALIILVTCNSQLPMQSTRWKISPQEELSKKNFRHISVKDRVQ
jgi:hypothetical protein